MAYRREGILEKDQIEIHYINLFSIVEVQPEMFEGQGPLTQCLPKD